MAIEYSWVRKKLAVDYFGSVTGINFVMKAVDGDKEEETNVVTLYSEHEQEDVKEWTQTRIDTLAETHREALEAELKRRLEKT